MSFRKNVLYIYIYIYIYTKIIDLGKSDKIKINGKIE